MSDWMIFAERITTEMERQQLSIRQLAEKMGMTTTTVSRYAKGERVPRANEVVRAADALGVTCDYLIGLSDNPHRINEQMETISRQAVKEWLAKWEGYLDADMIARMQYRVIDIPSALPEHSGGLYVDGYNDGYRDGWKEGREALRQAAIKAVDDLPNCYNGFSDTYDKAYIIGVLEELPSAQPYTDEEIQKMQDMEQAELEKAFELGREDAQPEIVRCKDCKYSDENWRRVSVRWLPCMDMRTGSNWFCGSAERRTDEQV